MFVASNKSQAKWSVLIVVLFVFCAILTSFSKSNNYSCETKNETYGFKFYLLHTLKDNILIPDENGGDACKYAFYKGVYRASTLFATKHTNLTTACNYINKKHPIKSWDQCFFMIGISISYTERSKIDKPEKLQRFIDRKINFCESTNSKSLDCIIGLYTGVNLAYQDVYKDSVFPSYNGDPFWLCKVGLGQKYKMQCYRNLVSYIFYYSNQDFEKAVTLIENNLADPFERYEVLLTYFSSLAYIPTYNYGDIQKLCISFNNPMTRYSCIVGYATGIDEVAPNGKEGFEVAKYCTAGIYNYKEQGECIRRGFFELPTSSDSVVKKQECLGLTPKKYALFCNVDDDPLIPAYLRQ